MLSKEKLDTLKTIFDADYYLEQNPDVRAHFNKNNAMTHFLQCGYQETGRKFKLRENYDFDCEFYLNTYKDLQQCQINSYAPALHHYLHYGLFEGRIGNEEKMKQNYENNKNQACNELQLKLIQNKKDGYEDKINILIRTSNRPQAFNTCIESILKQKYENYHVYVCFDKEESLDYLQHYEKNPHITYFPVHIDSTQKYKFNLYCNLLMDKVEEGYIMFLDDDDVMLHEKVFTLINNELGQHRILIWKFLRPDKLIYPQNIQNDIVLGEIDTACVCFYYELKEHAKWDDRRCGDYRFFSQLINPCNRNLIKVLNSILTGTQHDNKIGNWGN